MTKKSLRRARIASASLLLLLIVCLAVAKVTDGVAAPRAAALRVLLVGGGPDPGNNQAAIESNVRYVSRLVPDKSSCTTLFADGNLRRPTVLFYDSASSNPMGERILQMLLDDEDDGSGGYRAPRLGTRLHGPSSKAAIAKAFTSLSQPAAKTPVLLYFTGHGEQNKKDIANNYYNLWGSDSLSVRELSQQIARLPADVPVTLVMVQCYSGAFGNVLFAGGDPKAAPISRDVAGFFARRPTAWPPVAHRKWMNRSITISHPISLPR
jgi:hypothetical protein